MIKRIICCFFSVMLMSISIMSPVNANDVPAISIIGEMSDNLTLTSDNTNIFTQNNLLPGSSWNTNVHLVNKSNEDMKISLIDIQMNNENTELLKYLTLELMIEDEIIYSGSYDITDEVISVELKPKTEKIMLVKAGIDVSADNSLQGAKLDTTWVFEATVDVKETIAPTKKPSSSNRGSSGGSRSSKDSGIIAQTLQFSILCQDDNQQQLYNEVRPVPQSGISVIEAPEIEGYKPTKKYYYVNNNLAGKNIVFTYEKIENEETVSDPTEVEVKKDDDETLMSVQKGTPDPVQDDNSDKTSSKSENNVPVKTGNESLGSNTVILSSAGVLLILLIILVLLYKKKIRR